MQKPEQLPSGNWRGVARDAVTGKRFSKTFPRWEQASAWSIKRQEEILAAYQAKDIEMPSSQPSSSGLRCLPSPADPAYDFIVKTLAQLETFGLDANDPSTIRRAVAHGRAVHRLVARVQQQKQAAVRPAIPEDGEVIYYVRIGNRCKIGYTANMPGRMAAINPEEILATEPDFPALERVRHGDFAELRTHGEWFKLEEPLTSHIDKLRAGWQPPVCLKGEEPCMMAGRGEDSSGSDTP